jgi:hypothetical protein
MNDRFRLPAAAPSPADLDAIDQLGDREGFVERQPLTPTPKRKRGTRAQLHNFTMRVEVEHAAAFIRHCEQERIPYREAFARMLALLLSQNSNN